MNNFKKLLDLINKTSEILITKSFDFNNKGLDDELIRISTQAKKLSTEIKETKTKND